MASITRKLTKLTIHLYKLDTESDTPSVVEIEPLVHMCGTPNERTVRQAVNAKYGRGHNLTIGKVDAEEALYAIPMGVFMEFAQKVEKVEKTEEEN